MRCIEREKQGVLINLCHLKYEKYIRNILGENNSSKTKLFNSTSKNENISSVIVIFHIESKHKSAFLFSLAYIVITCLSKYETILIDEIFHKLVGLHFLT